MVLKHFYMSCLVLKTFLYVMFGFKNISICHGFKTFIYVMLGFKNISICHASFKNVNIKYIVHNAVLE